ncbi:YeeE/YedE family protein [Marinimicrobium alkaliphilum]|uniref:YeeE/YedE family protein n=1 Tax=Marinimicrobium alkaliphilum TaxID=2202654 RepID=UPI000DBA461E|nr:YeeE/YedE family protein [Marinimicrobium alkaliphilum]
MINGLFDDPLQAVLWGGLILGLLWGLVAQRSRFCLLRGLEHYWHQDDGRKLRAFAIALATAVLATQALGHSAELALHQTHYQPRALPVIAIGVGGVIFGFGMALANGCGARSLVLLGSGNLRSLVVLLVLGIGAYMAMSGLLAGTRQWLGDLWRWNLPATHWPGLLAGVGIAEPLARLLVSLLIALPLLVWSLSSAALRRSPADWLGGLLIGLLVTAGWWVTGVLGADDFDPTPLASFTFIAPIGDSLQYLMLSTGTALRFGVCTVAGILLGSLIAALAGGDFRWQGFDGPAQMRRYLLGGWLMGVGGVLALGCSIGQGLTGFSTLALGSPLALAAIILGTRLGLARVKSPSAH